MTAYRLAKSAGDYRAAKSLLREEGFREEELIFPTVLAMDQETWKVVGLLSTRIQDDMIVAGPLCLKSDKRRARTAIRLVDLYDIALRGMGIKSYIFHTEEGSMLDKAVERLELGEPYAVQNGVKFYVRRLN